MFIDNVDLLRSEYDQALSYDQFVALGDSEGHRPPWDQRHGQLALTDDQASLVRGFTRRMHVLCMSGTWCGDCALQGAAMQRIAESNPDAVHLRFVLRSEEHADLVVKSQINAGFRVPMTWFLAEDFQPVSCFGDRTLSRYRSMARKALPAEEAERILAPPPKDPVREVLHEVLDEFERVHLLLRLSPRLREIHGD